MKKRVDAIYVIFVSNVIFSILFQAFLIIYILFLNKEGIDVYKILALTLEGGIFLYSVKLFHSIIKKRIDNGDFSLTNSEISEKEIFPVELVGYFKSRKEALNISNVYDYPSSALTSCLIYIETILKKNMPDCSFELSIFTNTTHPKIISYFDSNGNTKSSSQSARDKDPLYYVNKKYKVVELLENPSYDVFVITSTNDHNYKFASKRQQNNIKSQIMYCFDVESPYVLVITCNKKGAFVLNDEIMNRFISTIGVVLKSEIILKEKFCCRKNFSCNQNTVI